MNPTSFARHTLLAALLASASLGGSSGVLAQNAADAQPTQPATWDDSWTRFYIENNRIQGSSPERYDWNPVLTGRIMGRRQSGDILVLKLKERGRVLSEVRCPLQLRGEFVDAGTFECHLRTMKVDHAGEFLLEVHYEDQNTGESRLIRTLTMPIIAYSYMIDRTTRSHTPMFALAARDMLGSSVVFLSGRPHEESTTQVEEGGVRYRVRIRQSNLRLRFWSTRNNLTHVNDAQLRCTVDGQVMALQRRGSVNIRVETNNYHDDRRSNGNDVAETRWAWNLWEVDTGLFVVEKGGREAMPPTPPGQVYGTAPGFPAPQSDATSMPGEWSCILRAEGQEIRRFVFRVTSTGIARHAEEQGENGLHFPADTYFAETFLADGSAQFDRNFQPDAVRRTGFFGRPWVGTPGMVAAPPRAFGDAQPAAVGGGGGARRRR